MWTEISYDKLLKKKKKKYNIMFLKGRSLKNDSCVSFISIFLR